MKSFNVEAVAGSAMLAAFIVATPTEAAFQGLSVVNHATVNIGGTDRTVYRVYANFSNPGDQVNLLTGSPTLGAMFIQSRNANDSAPGSNFANPGGAGDLAPTAADIALNPNVEWDSFYTIGVAIADQGPFGNQSGTVPFLPPLTGNNVTTSNGGWVALPTIDHDNDPGTPTIPNPQAQAGFLGDGDPLLRVLILQLTVLAGENVRGTLNVSYRLAGASTGVTIAQQTFNSVPGPGALVLLGVGLIGSTRRRRRIQRSRE